MAETIVIQESEVAEMQLFYQTELDKTLKRLQHIQGILKKLGYRGAESMNFEVETKTTSAPAPKRKAAPEVEAKPIKAKRGKKRGPSSVWSNFVVNRLTQLAKPLTYDQLVDEALEFIDKVYDQPPIYPLWLHPFVYALAAFSGCVLFYGGRWQEAGVAAALGSKFFFFVVCWRNVYLFIASDSGLCFKRNLFSLYF